MSHQVSGWSFYRVVPICDMIILKSQYRICFAVGDWPPFVTQEPTSPLPVFWGPALHVLCSASLKVRCDISTASWQSQASLVAVMSPRNSSSCLWRCGRAIVIMAIYTDLEVCSTDWNQDSVCVSKSAWQDMASSKDTLCQHSFYVVTPARSHMLPTAKNVWSGCAPTAFLLFALNHSTWGFHLKLMFHSCEDCQSLVSASKSLQIPIVASTKFCTDIFK